MDWLNSKAIRLLPAFQPSFLFPFLSSYLIIMLFNIPFLLSIYIKRSVLFYIEWKTNPKSHTQLLQNYSSHHNIIQ